MIKPSDAVRENINGWLAAFNNKDLAALQTYYDPQSYYANANAPMYHGTAQILPWYEQAFAAVQGTLVFKEEFLSQGTDMALLVGKYYFRPESADADATVGDSGRVALVYRRANDGRWLLLFDMDNAPPDVSPADFT